MTTTISTRYGRDHELVQRLRPESQTVREAEGLEHMDDLEFEIAQHKLNMVAFEGKETTQKLGASTAMRWGDVAFGIYTAKGDLAICATGIYHHAVLSQLPVKYIVKHYVEEPSVGLKEGDSFFYNDPFYGGVHNADMGLCVPLFDGNELVGFVGAAVHTGECGGSEPGGMVNAAKSRYDEGLLVPPIKIGEDFVLKEDLLAMLATMTRDPRTMLLDIKARLAAARIAERRIKEVLEEKGGAFFVGVLRRVLERTAQGAKKKVSMMHDGIYRQPRFMDSVGPESALMKVNLELEKRGDKLTIRLLGSSPMLQERPTNSYFQGILGLAMVYFCGWLFHDLPANNGLLEAIDWEFPENSFVNAQGDVPVSYAPATQVCFTQGMFMAGARMMYSMDPKRAVGAWYTGFAVTVYGGLNQWGESIADITPEINATGAGGRSDMDGVNAAGAFFATMSDCGDVESTEADRPFLYLFRNFYDNSYGHGKYRGGAGVGFGLMIHGTPGLAVGSMGFGSLFPATLGIFGGRAAPPVFTRTVSGSDMKARLAAGGEQLPHSMSALYGDDMIDEGTPVYGSVSAPPTLMQEGDTLYVPITGGAGYGDVLEREPEAVIKDLHDGLINLETARSVYGVIASEHTFSLDIEATTARRQQMFAERKARAKPYSEFVKEWKTQKPPNEILKYYGDYPYPGQAMQGA